MASLIKAFSNISLRSINPTANRLIFQKPQINLKRNEFFIPCRESNYFTKSTADKLWKGITTVSNAGKKKGRMRGLKKRKDLNKGQKLGDGTIPMTWPGLNAPIKDFGPSLKINQLPDRAPEEFKARSAQRESSSINRRATKIDPLDRGWAGTRLPGQKLGPPDPIGQEKFNGFETIALEAKKVCHMTGNFGRVYQWTVFSVTGNGNGLAGYALARSPVNTVAIRNSKNKAGQRLHNVELCDNHTVFHSFYVKFGKTKLFVERKHKGYGLVCHRAIKAICECIGIKNIYVKIEGAVNVQNATKAFFLGLVQQKTHSIMAEEKGLNLVEFRQETGEFPTAVASPTKCRQEEDIGAEEVLDYDEYLKEGREVLRRKKRTSGYINHSSWQRHLKKTLRFRNREDVRVNLLAEHGSLKEFYGSHYKHIQRPRS